MAALKLIITLPMPLAGVYCESSSETLRFFTKSIPPSEYSARQSGLAAAERSEGGPPGGPKRSAAAPEAGLPRSSPRPDSEVVASGVFFPWSTRILILEQADAASVTPGGVRAQLRQEGSYSSHFGGNAKPASSRL